MNKTAQRGQALIETAIALPLVLLTIYTLFWAAKYAIVTERLESTKRLTQHVLDSKYVYTNYSLVSLYNVVADADKQQTWASCSPSIPDLMTNFGNVQALPTTTIPREAMWRTALLEDPQCTPSHQILTTGHSYSRDFLFAYNHDTLAVQVAPPYASSVLFPSQAHSFNLTAQSIDLYQAGTVADLAKCYPALYGAVSASLRDQVQSSDQAATYGEITEAANDGEFNGDLSTVNATAAPDTLKVDPNCVGKPPVGSAPATATPPPYMPLPTPTPTPSPSPTPTPKPTPTPVPTPKAPASTAPSSKPSPGPTGTGGGSGGGNPKPSTSPGGPATPTGGGGGGGGGGTPGPSAAPTQAPTATPATAAPTQSPTQSTTYAPTHTPTTPQPVPTATPLPDNSPPGYTFF